MSQLRDRRQVGEHFPPKERIHAPVELLTDKEHEAVRLAGQLWNALCQVVGNERTREADLAELVVHVHAIQQAVMSQAATRAYPTTYRPLGGVLPLKATP